MSIYNKHNHPTENTKNSAAGPGSAGVCESHAVIWPTLGAAAIAGKTGNAWRVWTVAKNADRSGCGHITRSTLLAALDGYGIHPRTRARWIQQAVQLGLIINHRYRRSGVRVYFLVAPDRVAVLLGADRVGTRVRVDLADVLRSGWRAVVWSGYLADKQKPCSQETKEQMTGIKKRTQRNYQSAAGVRSRSNYVKRSGVRADHIDGVRSVCSYHMFKDSYGGVMQRLPSIYIPDPLLVATTARGRARKAQQRLLKSMSNISSNQGRREHRQTQTESDQYGIRVRLFHINDDKAQYMLDHHPEQPEAFVLYTVGERSNSWRAVENV